MALQKKDVLAAIEQAGGNQTEAARILGVPRSTLYDTMDKMKVVANRPPPEELEWDENGDTASLSIVTSKRIRTLDDALAYAEADMEMWEPSRFVITSHEQGQKDADGNPISIKLWNVKATLKRREPDHPVRCKDDIKDMLMKYSPKIPAVRRSKRKAEYMLEVSCPDIHIGKLCDGTETGDDYNIDIARKLYVKAHQHIIEQASKQYSIGSVLNIPSNDILHFSGPSYATTAGTRQDSDGTWQQAYRAAREVAIDGIEICRQLAPTKVITHTDNHANAEAFYIGDAIECYYRRDKSVTIDNGPSPHKFHRHGNVVLGFGHGHGEKYPDLQAIMARMQPEAFAQCTTKEWHLGHLHKEMLIDGYGDMMFRRLSSLSGTDSWHAGKGYGSKKSAMGFVWSQEGLESIIYFNPTAEDYKNERKKT